jgi:hypothetical protein
MEPLQYTAVIWICPSNVRSVPSFYTLCTESTGRIKRKAQNGSVFIYSLILFANNSCCRLTRVRKDSAFQFWWICTQLYKVYIIIRRRNNFLCFKFSNYFESNHKPKKCMKWIGAGVAQSVLWLAATWNIRWSNPGGRELFRTRPDRLWDPHSLLYKESLVYRR